MVIKGEWLFWENLTSREKLEKLKCDESGLPEKKTGKKRNCDEKEVGRIFKKSRL